MGLSDEFAFETTSLRGIGTDTGVVADVAHVKIVQQISCGSVLHLTIINLSGKRV